MLDIAAKLCATILVTLLLSERCCSLEVFYNNEVNNELHIAEGLSVPQSDEANKGLIEEPLQTSEILRYDLLKLFYGGNFRKNEKGVHNNLLNSEPISKEPQYNVQDNEISNTDESIYNGNQEGEIAGKSRVIRQAYTGHQQIYPKLPTNPPYNSNPSYPNYNPNQNQQWLPPPNSSQSGFSSNGSFNPYPSNPYSGNSPYKHYNNSAGQYPSNTPSPYAGYIPINNTMYMSGTGSQFQHGQFNNTYSNQRPPYSNFTPRNTLPVVYHPPVNNYNSTFGSGNRYNHSSGQYSRPQNGQNPQYLNPYPNNPYGQRNLTYPLNVPTQRPIYNPPNSYPGNNSVRPGQYSYNSTNTWPGHVNGPGGVPASPYGQNPPSFNPYVAPQNPTNNQYPGGNQFTGNFQGAGADTFNLAHGYNPSIPSRPPYNSGPGQTQFGYPYANNVNTQDPTKVNPGYFSYPH